MQVIELLERYSLIFILVIFSAGSLFAQTYPDKKVDSLLNAGLNQLLINNYEEAEAIFDDLSEEYNNLAFGDVYIAATEIIKSEDYLIDLNEEKVEERINSAEKKAEKLIKEDDENVWNLYNLALAKGIKAYFNGINGNYLNALDEGIASIKYFERCIEQNENFYDAYIAIGTYKYWKSIKLKPVLWLPFIKDEISTGKELLKESIDNSNYNKALGAYSLSWVYINDEEYEKAAELCNSYLLVYKGNRLFMWTLARAQEDINMEEALNSYKKILESLPEEGRTTDNKILINHKIAMIYNRMNEKEEALKLCNHILDVSSDKKISHDMRKRLERVKELKEKLEK